MTNLGEEDEFIEVPGYGLKRRDLRHWWNNVAQEPDEEILAIDKLEVDLEFRSNQDKKLAFDIRKAIGGLEGCHFKVESRINRIIYAIKNNHFPQLNKRESAQIKKDWVIKWESILDYLEKWSNSNSETASNKQELINCVKIEKINELLGEKTILKTRQVNFIVESIRELLELWFIKQVSSNIKWLQQKVIIKKILMKYEKLNLEFGEKTNELVIPIKEINHLVSIPELMNKYEYLVCVSNSNFMNDLLSILGAIGGKTIYVHQVCGLYLDNLKEFIGSFLIRLQKYLDKSVDEITSDNELMDLFAEKTPIKYWLVASLEKTIRFWN